MAESLTPLQRAFLALEDTRAKLAKLEREHSEPIAIVGLGCRTAGDGDGPGALWRIFDAGVDTIGEVPRERWDADAWYDPNPETAGTIATRFGGFLRHADTFDADVFGIAPREARGMDPQQRLFLEVSWEALEHAGIAPDQLRGSRTGVYLGICSNDYLQLLLGTGDPSVLDAHFMSGNAHSVAAGRLSYVLGLQGPAVAVDAACSSSLVAVHLACQALHAGDCRMALAGGVNLMLSPENFVAYSRAGLLAPDGRCKTFDAAADGVGRAEGCGVVVLKRLSDAQADGDRIWAVIRGSAVNQDGPSSSLTAPNGPAQEHVIRAAIARAGVHPHTIGYVEAHGTGTPLGDPIELRALGEVFGPGRPIETPLWVGSAKTNFGHLEAAAGILGVLKVVLALNHRVIPRHLHCRTPSPHIPWPDLPIRIPVSAVPWSPIGGVRRAGISAFGFSGTNAHVIVDEAPGPAPRRVVEERSHHLVTLSSQSEAALVANAAALGRALESAVDADVADVAHTLNTGRARFPVRATFVTATLPDLRRGLERIASGAALTRRVAAASRPRVAFLFTGQGSQYAGMGAALYRTSAVFRGAIDECAALLDPLIAVPLVPLISGHSPEDVSIDRTGLAQPALFALEYGLASLWRSWGVEPVAVLGHSVGEIAAACIAGVLSLRDAATVVATRGRLMQSLPSGGGMCAVFAPLERVMAAMAASAPGLEVAAVNGQEHVVVAGPLSALERLETALAAASIKSKRLPVSHAFHSALMDPMLEEFERALQSVAFAAPRVRLISNVTGAVADERVREPRYWVDHVRQPVRFAEGMATLADFGCDVMLEIGPAATLIALGQACVPAASLTWCPSLRRDRAEWLQILESLGELFLAGVPIDWAAVDRGHDRRTEALPTYTFQRARHWFTTTRGSAPMGERGAVHPLIGRRLRSPLAQAQFECVLGPDSPAFIRDHQAGGVILLPGTACLEMGLAAGRSVFGSEVCCVESVVLREALVFDDESPRLVQTIVEPESNGRAAFRVQSARCEDETTWTLHCEGYVRVEEEGVRPRRDRAASVEAVELVESRCGPLEDSQQLYADQRTQGFAFGPRFQGVRQLRRGRGEALGIVELPAIEQSSLGSYGVHPALLDACVQVMGGALEPAEVRGEHAALHVTVMIRRFTVFAPPGARCVSHVVLNPGSRAGQAYDASVRIYDSAHALAAEIEGLELQRVEASALADLARRRSSILYERQWEVSPLGGATTVGHSPVLADASDGAVSRGRSWLLLLDTGGIGRALASRLEERGDRCVLLAPPRTTAGTQEHHGTPDNPAVRRAAASDDGVADLHDAIEGLYAQPGEIGGIVDLQWLDVGGWECSSRPDEALRRPVTHALGLLRDVLTRNASVSPRVWLVTRGAQAVGESGSPLSVLQAAAWGMGRTVALEHPELRLVAIDLDPASDVDEVASISDELSSDGREPQVARRDGRRFVARLMRRAPASRRPSARPGGENYTIGASERGSLDGLGPQPSERVAPAAGEVEIAVAATGLNFRDVLNVLGLYPGHVGPIGAECAGTVTRVGAGVTGVACGDRVVASAHAAFSGFVVTRHEMVHPLPPTCTLAEGAALPIAYLTAAYALEHLGRLRAGETVLIHAAAGGVGLAAVHIARRAGARVIATVGSRSKRAYLAGLGIEHIFDSRSLAFADDVRAVTAGRGADVVLNSLSDEFVAASFRALADGGRFLEIGKRGIWTHEQVAALDRGVVYHIIDAGVTAVEQPELMGGLLGRLMHDVGSGGLAKLPTRVFDLADTRQAFRFMMHARQIGKIVVTHPPAEPARPARAELSCRPDATYVVTGGLAGIGLAVAQRLVERGARHLVLISRSGETPSTTSALASLRARGVEVLAPPLDVADEPAVDAWLMRVRRELPPIRGIVHGANVLDDGAIVTQAWPRFVTVLRPKVAGAHVLDRLTRQDPLDWFVLFSSVASMLGSAGQANYAAANAVLDTLAHERRRLGLPAQVVNWGPWLEVGVSRGALNERFSKMGVRALTTGEGLRAFEDVLVSDGVQFAALSADWSQVAHVGREANMAALISRLVAAMPASVDRPTADAPPVRSIVALLAEAPPTRHRQIVAAYLRERAATVLGLDNAGAIDRQIPLGELGMDSLLAVELRNTLSRALQAPLPATLLFDHPTLDRLTAFISDHVLELPSESSAPAPATLPPADGAQLLAGIAELSDEDVDRLLAAKHSGTGA